MDLEQPPLDPSTGLPLPPDAIQRILHITPKVHVYQIPPMSSMSGHRASDWTAPPPTNASSGVSSLQAAGRQIFTARLRVLETDVGDSTTPTTKAGGGATLSTCVTLEDPSTGALFAASPYDTPSAVEPVTDSSRFFAIRVRDPQQNRKALLGIGFEERSDAFDFSVALQEARRALGMEVAGGGPAGAAGTAKNQGGNLLDGVAGGEQERRDLSLKEGETITINLGGKFGARRREASLSEEKAPAGAGLDAFSLAPPPAGGSSSDGLGGGNSFLPPPPKTTQDVRAQKRLSRGAGSVVDKESAKALGFDDGQFGEFA